MMMVVVVVVVVVVWIKGERVAAGGCTTMAGRNNEGESWREERVAL